MKKIINENLLVGMGLTRENLYLFVGGLVLIILGYIALAIGDTYDTMSLVVGPILLIVGYVVILPLSIMYKAKKSIKAS